MEPDAVEIRVIGCLLEKQRTTPDNYPLSLNALRLACNQATNRDPVVDYDETTIRRALGDLGRRRWIRSASFQGSRAQKYRHLIDRELSLADDQLSLLAVLMLRGAQTPGELKQRAERLHPFADLTAIHETLQGLIERDLVECLPRRPGQKEERYEQRLGGHGDEEALEPASPAGEHVSAAAGDPDASPPPPAAAGNAAAGETDRIARLEEEVAALRAEIASLREAIQAQPTATIPSPPE